MYRGWPDRRRPRWPHWPARLRPGRLRQQVLVMRPALAAACFHAQQLRPSAQGFELARRCFGSAQRQPALACHLAARRSPALDQRRAGRDARVRRDAAGGDRPRPLVAPHRPQNPRRVAGMTGLRRPDLGQHPRLRRGSNRAWDGHDRLPDRAASRSRSAATRKRVPRQTRPRCRHCLSARHYLVRHYLVRH